MKKVLDLFSGIGGFSLGLERTGGFKTVAFCEIDPFCQKVLNKHWPDTPIYEDVRNLEHDGPIDVITGGYPCQPFSIAGKRQGAEDDRHLWPAMFGLIKKHRPTWVIGENVAGHIDMGLDNVLFDLGGEGYECRTFIIPACSVNAPHRRERVWIVANLTTVWAKQGLEGVYKKRASREFRRDFRRYWFNGRNKSRVCGKYDGLPNWLDRLCALGNAVVPQIPEIIGHAILEAEAACQAS